MTSIANAALPAAIPSEAPKAESPGAEANPRLWKAAQDFEAMALGQFLQPMFSTVDLSGGSFGGGAGEKNFQPMLVTEMAKEVERHGGLGLTQPIYQEMLKMQEKRR